MGHSHHFLSRLDRVSLPHVELALSLYRDVELLKYVLERARLPEGAERAAIALADSDNAPHIVVTREGRFVTCLAEGMVVDDIPIISRARLDGIAARGTDLRARFEVCKTLAGKHGGVGKLLARIHESGDELSREEMVGLTALAPLYTLELLKSLFASLDDLRVGREALERHLRHADRLKPALHRTAHVYWKTFWSVGHFSILSALDGPHLMDRLPPEFAKQVGSFSWCAVRQGVMSLALKGAWATARLGKPMLPIFKTLFREANSERTTVDACLGLLGIAARNSRLRAEIRKVFATGPNIDKDSPLGRYFHGLAKLAGTIADIADQAPEALADQQQRLGAIACLRVASQLPSGGPYSFQHVDEVPKDLAMTLSVNLHMPYLATAASDALMAMFSAMPWVGRAAPESMYLPRDFLRAALSPWTPEVTCDLIKSLRPSRPVPHGATTGPARQGPCPCGSGKKYKRCCNDEPPAPDKLDEEYE